MKLKCLRCGQEYEGSVAKDNIGFYGACPTCDEPFDVTLPEGRYAIAIASANAEAHTKVPCENSEIVTYTAFNDQDAFLTVVERMANETCSKWCWLLVDGTCFYAGSLAEGDIKAIKAHFEPHEKIVIFRSEHGRFIDMVIKVENYDDTFRIAAANAAEMWRDNKNYEYPIYVLKKLKLAGYRCEFVECEYFDDD